MTDTTPDGWDAIEPGLEEVEDDTSSSDDSEEE